MIKLKVLVVDDSGFFRRRVSEIIEQDPGLQVIGTANNGKEAIAKATELKPDVVTMDIEMPVMNGIDAVRRIMETNPVPILMFSSLTHDGAKATLDALDAGALDFLPKKFEDIARDRKEATDLLIQRIKQIARKRYLLKRRAPAASPEPARRTPEAKPAAPASSSRAAQTAGRTVAQPERVQPVRARASGKQYKLLAIGTSTGGPVALQNILTQLPANFGVPIVLVQHMPAAFTGAFAQRLNSLCKISVKEAEHGDILKPGCAYLAPGGMQMMVEGKPSAAKLKIMDGGERVNYKPSVDISFASLSKVYSGDVLGIILTGMGADGREGCRMLKSCGAKIWAQDEESCVVYGMPQAVTSAGIAEENITLNQIASRLLVEMGYG